jgi:hypothetical protein
VPSTYSPLKVELMATGENSGTWGTITNSNLGTALEEAIVGLATADFPSNADLTLTLLDTNATQIARHFVLNVTSSASLTTTRNLVVPAIEKPYLIVNNTTGGQSITVKNSTGSGVTVPNGKQAFVYNNGTDVVPALDYLPGLDLGTALPVSSGGTGASTLTGVVKGTGTSALTAGTVALGSEVSGTLPVSNGGTGATTLTSGAYLKGNGTSAVAFQAAPIPVSDGGTGATTLTAGSYLKGNGTSAVSLQSTPIPVSDGGIGVGTLTGVAIGNGTSAFSAKTNPSGAFVGTTDTQTLSNKTIERAILNDGYTEEVFTITDGGTVNLDPNNGSIQLWTLSASRTPGQANWNAGQSITLMVDDGTAYSITWSTLAVVWKTDGGSAPTLNASGFTVIVLWKVGTTIYGARVGNA